MVEVTNHGEIAYHRAGYGGDVAGGTGLPDICKAYTEPRVSDAYFMVVPTPFKGDHEPDVSFVESATRMVASFVEEGGFVRDRVYIAGGDDRTDG